MDPILRVLSWIFGRVAFLVLGLFVGAILGIAFESANSRVDYCSDGSSTRYIEDPQSRLILGCRD